MCGWSLMAGPVAFGVHVAPWVHTVDDDGTWWLYQRSSELVGDGRVWYWPVRSVTEPELQDLYDPVGCVRAVFGDDVHVVWDPHKFAGFLKEAVDWLCIQPGTEPGEHVMAARTAIRDPQDETRLVAAAHSLVARVRDVRAEWLRFPVWVKVVAGLDSHTQA